MTLLQLNKVTLTYPGRSGGETVEALSPTDLEVADGDFVVVVGPSGCGKTSLLNLIAGFLRPSAGEILLKGRPLLKPDADRGVVFQRHALFPWLNVIDNAAFSLRMQGVNRSERYTRARAVLDRVGLGEFESHRIHQLSGGMQQRLGIARVLVADPAVMLMDEPFGALDALTRETMQEWLLEVWSQSGKVIFFITHSVDEALFLGTRLIVLSPRPGRIVHEVPLSFSRDFLAGQGARAIRSDPAYIAMREEIYGLVRGEGVARG